LPSPFARLLITIGSFDIKLDCGLQVITFDNVDVTTCCGYITVFACSGGVITRSAVSYGYLRTAELR
jgi:hypothetical protein